MTRDEALAMLEPPNVVVSVDVPATLTSTSRWTWYENAPITPIRVGRRMLWRVSDLRAWLGMPS